MVAAGEVYTGTTRHYHVGDGREDDPLTKGEAALVWERTEGGIPLWGGPGGDP